MTARRALLAVAAVLLPGCGGDDGRLPLIVYSPHGEDILREFETAFEAAHPDVDVRSFNLSTGECLTRVRAERSNPSCDVWWGAPSSTFSRAAEEGLLAPYRASWAGAVPAALADPEDRFTPHFVIPQVILYNRDRMAPDEAPRRWNDLLDERFAGRVVLRFPLPSGSMRGAFAALIEWHRHESGDVDQGFAFLEGLHRNTKRYESGPTELFEAIRRDADDVVSIWNLTDAFFQRDRYRYPFGVVIPAEGVPVVIDCIALAARRDGDPARRAAAEAYFEFVTSLDALVPLMRDHYRLPVRGDVPVEARPEWARELQFERLPGDPRHAAAHEDEWMARWDHDVKPLDRAVNGR